jgi:lipoprotein NlpD
MLRSCLGLLALAWLVGCADSRKAAPISERKARPATPSAQPHGDAARGGYRVQAGDTLYKIAFEQDVDLARLAALNDLREPYIIHPGRILRLPGPLPEAAAKTAPEPAKAATEAWVWPARGGIIAGFDPALGRKGLDIAGARDTAIRAARSGTVVYAGSALRGYGKLTIIQHGPTLLTAYGHQATSRVVEGQRVAAGQVIGGMGDSDTDRVKLHFEVREFGKPVDPRLFLPRQD